MRLRLEDKDEKNWYVERGDLQGRLTVRFVGVRADKIPVKIWQWGMANTPRDALLQLTETGLKFYHPEDPSFVFNDVVAAFDIGDDILRIGGLAQAIHCEASYQAHGTVLGTKGVSLSMAELILENANAWAELPKPQGARIYLERDKATGLVWLYNLGNVLLGTKPLPARLVVWMDNDNVPWTLSNEFIDLFAWDSASRTYDLFANLSIDLNVLLQRG